MQINIYEPSTQTALFLILFLLSILLTLRKDANRHEMLHSHTNELKGAAILMVFFCHVGYFLSADSRFLFPLSVAGGVGVNVFLFLSGFGNTLAMLRKPLTPLEFYKKRLPAIYLPMWLVLTVFIFLDLVLLKQVHPNITVFGNYLGYFPRADIFLDINSPLWYFTWILLYYLLFPHVFIKKFPAISACLIFLSTTVLLMFELPVVPDVQKLYKLHTFAFPLGMLFASLLNLKPLSELKSYLYSLRESHRRILYFSRYLILIALGWIIYFTAINSGVGDTLFKEQLISIVTALSLVMFFILKRYKSNLIALIGVYSYEIYLIQWPLIYRYDFVYKYLPAGVATFIYVFILIGLAIALNKLVKKITQHS